MGEPEAEGWRRVALCHLAARLPGLRSTRLRWRVLYPQTYPQCTHGKEKWGKMGENGGGNGGKWGKVGKNKETWVVQPVPFPPISSAFPPHFPPFSPIFPRELSPMRPPHSLVANLNLDFWPFQPLNSIAFGSAPRREVDSQPFSPCARPAGSQTETETERFFLSVADAPLSSGRMVKQPPSSCMISGSNPGRLFLTPPPPLKVTRPGFEPPTKNLASAAIPFDRRWSESG